MTAARQPPSDPAAVHRGLLAIARERKADFNAILAQYAIERLIDRLSRSPESPRFVLKGAMLFRVWTGELHRPTKDVDFLGHGDPSPAVVADAVRTIVSVKTDDGLRFALETISASGAFDSRHSSPPLRDGRPHAHRSQPRGASCAAGWAADHGESLKREGWPGAGSEKMLKWLTIDTHLGRKSVIRTRSVD